MLLVVLTEIGENNFTKVLGLSVPTCGLGRFVSVQILSPSEAKCSISLFLLKSVVLLFFHIPEDEKENAAISSFNTSARLIYLINKTDTMQFAPNQLLLPNCSTV